MCTIFGAKGFLGVRYLLILQLPSSYFFVVFSRRPMSFPTFSLEYQLAFQAKYRRWATGLLKLLFITEPASVLRQRAACLRDCSVLLAKAAIPLFHSRLLGKAIVHERELDAELFRFWRLLYRICCIYSIYGGKKVIYLPKQDTGPEWRCDMR